MEKSGYLDSYYGFYDMPSRSHQYSLYVVYNLNIYVKKFNILLKCGSKNEIYGENKSKISPKWSSEIDISVWKLVVQLSKLINKL